MNYLYVIDSGMEYSKIGVSNDLETRLADLQTGNPLPLHLRVAYEFPSAYMVEKVMHQKFSEKRAQGEWFRLSVQDLKDLCTICEMLGGQRVENKPIASTEGEIAEAEERQQVLEDFRMEKRINPENGEIRGFVFRSRDGRRAIVKYVGKRASPEEFKELLALEEPYETQM